VPDFSQLFAPGISPALAWSLVVGAAIIIGISKTGFPGVGILSIPLVAIAIDPKKSTGTVLPMLIVGDCMAVFFYRRHAVIKYLFKVVPCAVAGVLIGFVFLGMVTSAQLKPIIGAVILVMLSVNWWRNWRLAKSGAMHIPEGWWFAAVLGVTAGIITMMANAAGPIMVIYLLAMRLPKDAFIGTGAWYALSVNVFKVPFSASLGLITATSLTMNLMVAPVIILGGFLGLRLVKHVPEKPFTWLMQALAVIAAVDMLVQR
jgi:uncharacterized membrane protein YfcA